MASEGKRTTKNKRIELPDGSEVLFPIIDKITFVDPVRRHQETEYSFDNTATGDRTVHVAWVGAEDSDNATETPDPGAETPDDCLAVERIDKFSVIDPVRRYQEMQTLPDNGPENYDEDGPPYFTTHERTHVLRVVNDPDDGSWIETEVIDEFRVRDPVRRQQDVYFVLLNPEGEDDGQGNKIIRADPNDEEISGGGGVDPAWRTDPFQNIVRISGGGFWLQVSTNVNNVDIADPLAKPSTVTVMNGTQQVYACQSAFHQPFVANPEIVSYQDVYVFTNYPTDGRPALTISVFSHYEAFVAAAGRPRPAWELDSAAVCQDDQLAHPLHQVIFPGPPGFGIVAGDHQKPSSIDSKSFTISVNLSGDLPPNMRGVYFAS